VRGDTGDGAYTAGKGKREERIWEVGEGRGDIV
jgi:hypothetical protein